MTKRNISDFYNNDVPAYGSYDNIRKCCAIDGLKASQRKLIWSAFKRCANDFLKTESFANQCACDTAYIHGSANLTSVIDTLTANYVGANNYPLFTGNSGGFGCRISPRASAARYTRVKLSDISKLMFKDIDHQLLEKQYFEGQYIEPQYLIPTFPVVFLNGSEGLSTGFSQKIFPRNPLEIIEYIRKKISGTENPRMQLLPWFKGHNGKVEVNKETHIVEVFGAITKNNMTSYTITELPIGIEYQKYVEFLDRLCDNGTIQDYVDKCDPKKDSICFEIKTTREFTRKYSTDRKVIEILHLVKSLPETLCCIDTHNRIYEFKSIHEILDAFITLRLHYYDLRKKHILTTLTNNLAKLNSKYIFVKAIVDKKIIVANKKKVDIIAQIKATKGIIEIDGSYEYLLRMPIYSLSAEVLEELKKEIADTKAEYDTVNKTTIQEMWMTDLKELKKVL